MSPVAIMRSYTRKKCKRPETRQQRKEKFLGECHQLCFLLQDMMSYCNHLRNMQLRKQKKSIFQYQPKILQQKNLKILNQLSDNLSQSILNNIKMSDSLSLNEIPNFQLNLNDQELQYRLKDLDNTVFYQKNELEKIKKDCERRPLDSAIAQCTLMAANQVDIDPLLLRIIIKRTQKKAPVPQEITILKRSGRQLSKKLSYVSQGINFLYEQLKIQQKRISTVQLELPNKISEQHNYQEKRITDLSERLAMTKSELLERIQSKNAEAQEKIKELEKKTLWQINDCKAMLATRINEQYVKDALKEFELVMINKMREYQARSTIDPERVMKIEERIAKIESENTNFTVQTNFKFKNLIEKIETTLVKKAEHGDDHLNIEKRLALMNSNLAELSKRLIFADKDIKETNGNVKKVDEKGQGVEKQVKRISELLKNLKLGEQFQKMMQKLDPHKICEMDNQIEILEKNDQRFETEVDLIKKQIDKMRSKTEFINSLQLQQQKQKESPAKRRGEEIQGMVQQFLSNNMYMKKIQWMQNQLVDAKSNNELLVAMQKKINKMQRQSETHNILYQIKGLEEYLKRENLVLSGRITQLEIQIKQQKTKRPSSAGRNNSLKDSKVSSAINFKKLLPVNCIGCFNTPGMFSNDVINENASTTTRGKALTALMSSRQK